MEFCLGNPTAIANVVCALLYGRISGVILRGGSSVLCNMEASVSNTKFCRKRMALPQAKGISCVRGLALSCFSFPRQFGFVSIGCSSKVRLYSKSSFEFIVALGVDTKGCRPSGVRGRISRRLFEMGYSPIIGLFRGGARPLQLSSNRSRCRMGTSLCSHSRILV